MKVKVWVQTRKVGSKCFTTIDIDDVTLAGLDSDIVEGLINEDAKQAMFEMVEWDWDIVKD